MLPFYSFPLPFLEGWASGFPMCARSTGAVHDRALREHGEPTGQPLSSSHLGQYIITVTPTRHTIAPITSKRSGPK